MKLKLAISGIEISYEGLETTLLSLFSALTSGTTPAEEDGESEEPEEEAKEAEEEDDGAVDNWAGYLSTSGVAERMGLKIGTLYYRIKSGAFPGEDSIIDGKKAWLIETVVEELGKARKKTRFEIQSDEDENEGEPEEVNF